MQFVLSPFLKPFHPLCGTKWSQHPIALVLHPSLPPSHPQLLHPSARRFWIHLLHAFMFAALQACLSLARSSSAFQGRSLLHQGLFLTPHVRSQAEELLFPQAEPSCAQWEGGREGGSRGWLRHSWDAPGRSRDKLALSLHFPSQPLFVSSRHSSTAGVPVSCPTSLCPALCPCVLLCVPITGQTPPARPSSCFKAPFLQTSPWACDKTPQSVCSRSFLFVCPK